MQSFKELQRHWYELLRKSGFEDIERNPREIGAHQIYARLSPTVRTAREEYFQVINYILVNEDPEFRNEVDRFIMFRHAQGDKIENIVNVLAARKMPRARRTVRVTIRKYLMAWNLRSFTTRQRNNYYVKTRKSNGCKLRHSRDSGTRASEGI